MAIGPPNAPGSGLGLSSQKVGGPCRSACRKRSSSIARTGLSGPRLSHSRYLQGPAIAKQLLQGHWDSERLSAQLGNSVACGTTISRSAFYPTVPDHVAEYPFACRRQSFMWRPLRLHELLQNVPLPHVGIGTAHFGFPSSTLSVRLIRGGKRIFYSGGKFCPSARQ